MGEPALKDRKILGDEGIISVFLVLDSSTGKITGGPHETFGDSTLTVRYSGMKNWDHLVAVLSASGIPTAISTGACALTGASGVAQIHFMNESVRVPAGASSIVCPRVARRADMREKAKRMPSSEA